MGMVVRIVRVFRVSRLACEFRAGVVPEPVECADSLHITFGRWSLSVPPPLLAVQNGNQGRKQHSRGTSGRHLPLPNFPKQAT
jgi:hypothetical protein